MRKIVGEAIHQLFGGDIAGFLAAVGDAETLGGLARLLNGHIERLTELEREVITLLALDQEPVSLAELAAHMDGQVRRAEIIDTVQTLRRRSLLLLHPAFHRVSD